MVGGWDKNKDDFSVDDVDPGSSPHGRLLEVQGCLRLAHAHEVLFDSGLSANMVSVEAHDVDAYSWHLKGWKQLLKRDGEVEFTDEARGDEEGDIRGLWNR